LGVSSLSSDLGSALSELLEQLQAVAHLETGDLLVIGCSTSEVIGQKIGTASCDQVAQELFSAIMTFCASYRVEPAFQCCEHLNRALVVTRAAARAHNLDDVTVIPRPGAGGALASQAMAGLSNPVVVEHLAQRGKAGIDIGHTLIGMHLRPVVVPVRTKITHIGQAPVVSARTRPKLIGGKRAHYPENRCT